MLAEACGHTQGEIRPRPLKQEEEIVNLVIWRGEFICFLKEQLDMEILTLEELEEFEPERRTKFLVLELLQCSLITSVAASLIQLWSVLL